MMIQAIAQSETNETQIAGVLACAAEVLVHLKTRLEQNPENKRVWIDDGVLRVDRAAPPKTDQGG